MGENEGGWKHKAEWYEKRNRQLTKELLNIKKRIEFLELEAKYNESPG